MEELKYKVYVVTDENKCIINIESDLTLEDTEGYIQIDEGTGDKYAHAQNYYFPKEKPLKDNLGRCNYKYENGEVSELAEEEKLNLFPRQEVTSEENLIDKLILDNINMQSQIDSLIQAQLGGI